MTPAIQAMRDWLRSCPLVASAQEDGVAFRICAYHFAGFDYFRFPEIYRAVTAQEVCEFLTQAVRPETCAISVITPSHDAPAEGDTKPCRP